MLVLELARCKYILRCENIIALGNSGTGKAHIALSLGLAACQKGFSVAFTTAAGLIHKPMEARDEKRLVKFQRGPQTAKLLIIDKLGYVPLAPTGAEQLFEVFSQRCEHDSTIVTSNLSFEEWTSVLGSERLTGALLDRFTHHVHIPEHERRELPPGTVHRPAAPGEQGSAGRRRRRQRPRPGHRRDPTRLTPTSIDRSRGQAPIEAWPGLVPPHRRWPDFAPPLTSRIRRRSFLPFTTTPW